MSEAVKIKLSKKDFESDQDVRWCPGCGDYAILATVQRTLATLGVKRETTVFVSGIGCSSRFPYYMNTYGFHTIHGRAPAVATGVKCANPELDVWVITGDGDAFSIGGNHILHLLRRNVGLKVILFNNRIYSLTKGQYSPTSELGKVTKSTPYGSIDAPLNPLAVALAAGATFVARTIDVDIPHQQAVLKRAAAHVGTAFVEIYQDCNVYNHKAWEYATDRETKGEKVLYLENGKPLIFGKQRDRGIRLHGLSPEAVTIGAGIAADDLVHHDESSATMAYLLAQMRRPEFPEPLGVLRAVSQPTYESLLSAQVDAARKKHGPGDLDALFNDADTWTVSA